MHCYSACKSADHLADATETGSQEKLHKTLAWDREPATCHSPVYFLHVQPASTPRGAMSDDAHCHLEPLVAAGD